MARWDDTRREWLDRDGSFPPAPTHRRVPAAFWFLVCLALTLLLVAGAALANAPESSPAPMPRPEGGE